MTGKSGWYEGSEISAFFYYPNQAIFTAPGTADKKTGKGQIQRVILNIQLNINIKSVSPAADADFNSQKD
ncbi:hypothetical protein Q4R43_12465 [Morganella morganii]